MLRPRVDFPYVPNKKRPYFVIKTRYDNEPKAAFIPRLNRLVSFGI